MALRESRMQGVLIYFTILCLSNAKRWAEAQPIIMSVSLINVTEITNANNEDFRQLFVEIRGSNLHSGIVIRPTSYSSSRRGECLNETSSDLVKYAFTAVWANNTMAFMTLTLPKKYVPSDKIFLCVRTTLGESDSASGSLSSAFRGEVIKWIHQGEDVILRTDTDDRSYNHLIEDLTKPDDHHILSRISDLTCIALPHVLGFCPHGEALRNVRHHTIRRILAEALQEVGYVTHEEVTGIATQGSTRRIDIIAYKAGTKKGYILDPTVRFEVSSTQPFEVDQEKKNIYEPTTPYYKEKYELEEIEVIGLLIGALGTITSKFVNICRDFRISNQIILNIATSALKGSIAILRNHLYNF